MPMEAHVSPLPRELTTPPVTKMCLAMKPASPPDWLFLIQVKDSTRPVQLKTPGFGPPPPLYPPPPPPPPPHPPPPPSFSPCPPLPPPPRPRPPAPPPPHPPPTPSPTLTT